MPRLAVHGLRAIIGCILALVDVSGFAIGSADVDIAPPPLSREVQPISVYRLTEVFLKSPLLHVYQQGIDPIHSADVSVKAHQLHSGCVSVNSES